MKPSTAHILTALRRAGPLGATGETLNRLHFRYGGRLFELRQAGYQIETVPGESAGRWKYILKSEPRGVMQNEEEGQGKEGREAAEDGHVATPRAGGVAAESAPPEQGTLFGEYVKPWRG